MDWYDHFSDDFRGAIVDSLLETGSSRILSGFSCDDAVGPLAKTLISVISDAIGELWAIQTGDGMSPLRVSDAIESLGLSDRNLPFVRELQDTLDTQRDHLVGSKDALDSLMDRAKTWRSRDILPEHQFVKRGKAWDLTFRGKTTHVPDGVGAKYLILLLLNQGVELYALDMISLATGNKIVQVGRSKDLIADKEAMEQYEKHAQELAAQITEARNSGRVDEQEKLTRQLEQFVEQMKNVRSLGKKSRSFGGEVEKARVSVTNALNRLFDDGEIFTSELEEAKKHFKNAISTGVFVSYKPERTMDWIMNI